MAVVWRLLVNLGQDNVYSLIVNSPLQSTVVIELFAIFRNTALSIRFS